MMQLGMACALVALLALVYFFRTGQLLLYGDAVAHINIARRVTDSLTPGLRQLGTVWLPLPHLLMAPLVANDWLWSTGLGGSLLSLASYVAATLGVFRLVFDTSSRSAAWIAALFFAANPDLLYLSTTAMTEPLFLATAIWSVVYVAEFARAARARDPLLARPALWKAAAWLSAGMLTRYDGWFLALACVLGVLLFALRVSTVRLELIKPIATFALLCAIVPAAWFTYNYALFKDPLAFADGPYSAKGVEARTGDTWHHPGYHSISVANTFFVKAAKLNTGEGRWQHWPFLLAVIAAVFSLFRRQQRPALLLWSMLPFYDLSIAYGGVPIFMPQWWPHSYYNVRYGLALLPAIAIFLGFLFELFRQLSPKPLFQRLGFVFFLLLTAGCYASIWRATPIVLREARVNSITRQNLEHALAAQLRFLPPDSSLLMYTGDYAGALQQADVHLRRVVNETNFHQWPAAMKSPADAASFIIAVQGDPVDSAVRAHPHDLQPLAVIHSFGKPPVTIYRSALHSQ